MVFKSPDPHNIQIHPPAFRSVRLSWNMILIGQVFRLIGLAHAGHQKAGQASPIQSFFCARLPSLHQVQPYLLASITFSGVF